MNNQFVEEILNVIKTATDKSVIAKSLIKLRTDVVKDKNGILLFRKCGGIAPMVRLLNKPHEKTLEIALSILGNCCTDEMCCKEAFENNISTALICILKSIPNQIIQCRACRLLGNLAKVDISCLGKAVHYTTTAHALCDIIHRTSDVQTRSMAFRASRLLLFNSQYLNYFLQANGLNITINILTSLMKNNCMAKVEEELLKDVPTKLKAGLKSSQHREKYFEEVARNLEGVRSDIFDYEILKNTIQNSNEYIMPKEKNAIDLLNEILKCLVVLSGLHIGLPAWQSFQRGGCTFAPIVFFLQAHIREYRGIALKILSNFVKNTGAFHALSSADAILAACELLTSGDPNKHLNESEARHSINIISVLSTDACNRSKIRRSGALKKLISIMRESKSHTEKFMVLYVFQNFQYDEMSMNLMLREGLINILINELKKYTLSDEDYYKKKREEKLMSSKKRKYPATLTKSTCKTQQQQQQKIPKFTEEFVYECDSSGGSASPCSSRSLSPTGVNFNTNGNYDYNSFITISIKSPPNISGNLITTEIDGEEESYSPVCSDDDDDDDDGDGDEVADDNNDKKGDFALYLNSEAYNIFENLNNNSQSSIPTNTRDIPIKNDINEDNMLLDKDDDEDDDDDDDDNNDNDDVSQDIANLKVPQIGNLPNKSIDIIDNLLFRITCLVRKVSDLGKSDTIITLIKAIAVFGSSMDLAGSLTNILMESQFFVQVIKCGIAHQLYQLTKIKELNKEAFGFLDTLSSVGECNYGKEQLAFFLRSDDINIQKRAAITIGYIIKNKTLLHQFLNEGSALSLLFNSILSAKQDEFTIEAIDSLTCLSRYTLGIQIPYHENSDSNGTDLSEMYEEFDDTESIQLYDNCDMHFYLHPLETNDDKNSTVTTRIAFNKAVLCASSEVFNTMLNSDFREGNEGDIHLRTYTVAGVRYFLNLIARQSLKLKLNIPPANNFKALLEAFEMSRIYIIPELEQKLQQLLIYRLNETNCLKLLEWSLNNYHIDLTEITINFYLCSCLSTTKKVALFRNADYSNYSTQWFQMLFEVIFSRCGAAC